MIKLPEKLEQFFNVIVAEANKNGLHCHIAHITRQSDSSFVEDFQVQLSNGNVFHVWWNVLVTNEEDMFGYRQLM